MGAVSLFLFLLSAIFVDGFRCYTGSWGVVVFGGRRVVLLRVGL